MDDTIILECQEKMDKCVDNLKANLSTIRAGRISLSIFEDVKADYYGEKTPITYMATVNLTGPNQVMIKPYDRNDIKAIVAAINESNIGVNPISEGDCVRVNFPTLTEERRKEFVKLARKYGEESKIAIRNVRRDYNEMIKRDKELPEDMAKFYETEVQKVTDEAIKRIDSTINTKEEEILEI